MAKIKKMSPAEYQRRLQPLLNLQTVQKIVEEITLSDQKPLKNEKINEWEQGLRPDGNRIGFYRDPEYAIFKEQINPRADGTVDLLLSRQTASTLFVSKGNKNGSFIFGMNDTHNLIGRYGIDILGLNQEWFNKRQNDIYRLTLVFDIKRKFRIG